VERSWNARVRRKVVRGGMGGRTAKVVSPTRPRVVECRAVGLTGRLSFGATMPGGVRRVYSFWMGGKGSYQ